MVDGAGPLTMKEVLESGHQYRVCLHAEPPGTEPGRQGREGCADRAPKGARAEAERSRARGAEDAGIDRDVGQDAVR